MNDQRSAFEKHYASMNDGFVPPFFDGEYDWGDAQACWLTWQAAQAALAQPRAPISDAQIEQVITFVEKLRSVFAKRFPRCRDCADECGICPTSGLPCEWPDIRALLAAQGDMENPVSEAITRNPVLESAQGGAPECRDVTPKQLIKSIEDGNRWKVQGDAPSDSPREWVESEESMRGAPLRKVLLSDCVTVIWHSKKPVTPNPVWEVIGQ